MDEKLIRLIVDEVCRQLAATGRLALPDRPPSEAAAPAAPGAAVDITAPEVRAVPLVEDPASPETLLRMKKRTTARIGVGRSGPRLNTRTMLTLRADHAQARDAVFSSIDPEFLKSMNLMTVRTLCPDKQTFITRPDLGRKLSPESEALLREKCRMRPDVQIYAADGLSTTAIRANLDRILPILTENLTAKGLTVGTPFYMEFGRVAAEDRVAELLGAKVVCVLIGERPGLATARSMSAYIAYNAHVGMPEARRTVVSNIHRDGLNAAEAGAYIAEVIEQIYRQKASGIELVK